MPQVISSVKALINNNHKYLFLRESLHHGDIWDLPGGKIIYSEEPEQALVREVREEVGISIKIIKAVGVWWFYSQNNKHQVICHTFLCAPVGSAEVDMTGNPADEHHVEYRWLSAKEALKEPGLMLADSLRKILRQISLPTSEVGRLQDHILRGCCVVVKTEACFLNPLDKF